MRHRIRANLLVLATLLVPRVGLADMEATARQELQQFDAELRERGH